MGYHSCIDNSDREDRREATQEERQRIVKTIREGRVEMADPEALARMDLHKPDFEVVGLEVGFSKHGMRICWSTKSAGFGTTTFYIGPHGEVRCDNEAMSKRFLKELLSKMIDMTELDD